MVLHNISSMEKALKFVKRRINNKIIFITNIGFDKSGRRFIEIVRKMYEFNIIVLFFSGKSENHFSWIKDFPNCLFDDSGRIYKEYLTDYNKEDLKKLRIKNEGQYKMKYKNFSLMEFSEDFLKYSKINKILKDKICPYIRHCKIYCRNNQKFLCMGKDAKVKSINKDNEDCYWDITVLDNTITFNCNGLYLNVNNNGIIEGSKNISLWNYELINNLYYYFFYTLNESKNYLYMEKSITKINISKPGENGIFLLIDIEEKDEDPISMLASSISSGSSISPYDLTNSRSLSSSNSF